jgi:hypothetical protein
MEMLNWLKRLFGTAPAETKQEPLVLENPVVKAVEEKPTETKPAKPKKAATKKAPAAPATEAPKKRGRKPKSES